MLQVPNENPSDCQLDRAKVRQDGNLFQQAGVGFDQRLRVVERPRTLREVLHAGHRNVKTCRLRSVTQGTSREEERRVDRSSSRGR